jgi:LAS superfamily LD-carboxypeptidase LdcB
MAHRSANPPPLDDFELTGRAHTHVLALPGGACRLHPAAAGAWLAMQAAAQAEGLALVAVSGFRDFDQQLAIWNAKFRGERPLLDRHSHPLMATALEEPERVAAILVWSALPGASRHHWGSDCDVVDRAALRDGEVPRLLDADFAPGGRHARLAEWLARHAVDYGFFRPYDRDRGGVQPEPWHLSFAPVAGPALARMNSGLLAEALAGVEIGGRETILRSLPELFGRYVAAVAALSMTSRAARPA